MLPTVSARNCYGICSSRIYSGHRQPRTKPEKRSKPEQSTSELDGKRSGLECSQTGHIGFGIFFFTRRRAVKTQQMTKYILGSFFTSRSEKRHGCRPRDQKTTIVSPSIWGDSNFVCCAFYGYPRVLPTFGIRQHFPKDHQSSSERNTAPKSAVSSLLSASVPLGYPHFVLR